MERKNHLHLQNDEDYKNFKLKKFKDLPKNIDFKVNSGMVFDTINNLPCFQILNSENEVIFEKQGYTIGLGEQMLRYLTGLP